jgi:hypothetical protein
VPFRTDSLSACAHYYRTLSGFTHASGQLYRVGQFLNPEIIFTTVMALVLCLPDWNSLRQRWRQRQCAGFRGLNWQGLAWTLPGLGICAELLILILAIAQLTANSYNPFIYFRF